FTADELANGSVKIIGPEHFNGEVQAAVHAVTTERDGDSLTGNAVNIKAIVTPTVDSGTTVVAGSSGLIEDNWGKVNFHVRHDSGDRDEYLSKVWIKVSDTQRADFSFGLGEEYLAFAGQPVQTIDGEEYYVLTAEQFGNLYIRAADNTHHGSDDPLRFDFKYEITDPATTGEAAVSGPRDGLYSATVQAVSDEVVLTGDSETVLTESAEVAVGIRLTKQDDHTGGSEQFVQDRVCGVVPGSTGIVFEFYGTDVRGPSIFLGNGAWLLTIPAIDAARFDTEESLEGKVMFYVGPYAEASMGKSITIETVTQDDGAANFVSDTVSWTLTTA